MLTVPVVKMFVTNKNNRPFKKNTPQFLAVHWTANENKGADAEANARYFNNTTRHASAHYIVDDKQIVLCIPEDEIAYSVGAQRYTAWARQHLSPNPNATVISVEMCVNRDGKFWQMYSNTAHLCADLLNRNDWEIARLIRHYDVTGKNCPAFFVQDITAKKYTGKSAAQAWTAFKNDVSRLMKEAV